MTEEDILIIGGGPAGLSTAGALRKAGLSSLIIDKGEVGESWTNRYERLHLHTVRAFSGLAHLRIPLSYPRYIPKDRYADYLRDYAKHFDLQFRANSCVTSIQVDRDRSEDRIIVSTESDTWKCRVVIIAAGQFGSPIIPEWQGRSEYSGRLMHSADYESGKVFAGKRVLVIGCGNSGAEIAADLAENAAHDVTLSIRSNPAIVPREFLGTPTQIFGIAMSRLPPRIADRIGSGLARLALGDLTKIGFGPPAWQPFTSRRTPIIDVGLIKNVRDRRVKIRSGVLRLTPTGAVFTNGEDIPFDCIIASTGYSTGLENIITDPSLIDDKGFPLFASGEPTSQPGLFFMGYIETHRGHLYEANIASRKLAPKIVKYLSVS